MSVERARSVQSLEGHHQEFLPQALRSSKGGRPQGPTFTMPMPSPQNAPVVKRYGTRMGRGRKRFFVPASTKKKHPLHKIHFGTFSPIKPLVGDRRKYI